MLRSRSPSPWLRAGLSSALLISAAWGLSGCPEGSPTPPVRLATLAVGDEHVCALRGGATTNEVVCWGDNNQGQLGVADRDRCLPVPGLSGVTQLAACAHYTCALLNNGTVRCWGQMLNFLTATNTPPMVPPNLTDAMQVSAGLAHVCVLRAGGTVRCWGNDGVPDLSSTNSDVPGLSGVTQVSTGSRFACAVVTGGAVRCFGDNSSFQRAVPLSRTTNIPNLTGMVQVSAGGGHACAVHATGTVRCFGDNSFGQLGGSSTTTDVPGLTGVRQLVAGLRHTCAVLAGGTVRCWGVTGLQGSSPTTDVPGLTDVIEVSVSSTSIDSNTCARRRDGTIRCWGDNAFNQLGVRRGYETGTLVTPVCVPGCATSAPATPTTCRLTCVDTQTNDLHCGACGTVCTGGRFCRAGMCQAPTMCPTGQTACGTPAVCVNTQTDARHCGRCDNALPGGQVCVGGVGVTGGATQLAAGESHTCAITAGTVRCWGSDLIGERGDGEGYSGETCSGPSEIPGMPPVPAVELTAGANHTCARLMDNTVRCWGYNQAGQLGDGSLTTRTSPVAVTGVTNAVEIAAGYSHTCARLMDNTVRCWGANGSGQLGDDSTTNRRSPVAVMGLTNVAQIAAGSAHTCARLMDNTVRCWGANLSSQLGDGSTTQRNSPVAVMGLTDAVEIAAGGAYTCARRMDNTVRCWGANGRGQLGDGSTDARTSPVAVMGLTDAVEIGAGFLHACARRADNTVRCWGDNFFGRLGDGTAMNRSSPVAVMGLTDAAEIALGRFHTCARSRDNTVRCWGSNSLGQLGDGSLMFRLTPVAVACFSTPAPTTTCMAGQTSCGMPAMCVDTQTSSAHCGACGNACATGSTCVAGVCEVTCAAPTTRCGSGDSATCENLQTSNAHCGACDTPCTDGRTCTNGSCPEPTMCPSGQTACGTPVSCVNTQTDARHCGRCGNALPEGQFCVGGVGVTGGATQLAAGHAHTCAITAGTVRCWGSDIQGQRGDGAGISGEVCSGPSEIPGMPPIPAVEVALGREHTCARLTDNTVRCWGSNANGQLGDGSTSQRAAPVAVMGLTNAVQIAAGRDHTCARLMDNTARCWGSNLIGQLGDDSMMDRTAPVAVMGLTNVAQIAAGQRHTCARLMDNTVRCWGWNQYGQLGDGSTQSRAAPVAVPGLTNVVEIAAGEQHTCARLMDNTVRCWGRNYSAQLGDGSLMDRTAPVAVTGLTNVVQLVAGLYFTCARLMDNTVRCWGSNAEGQLGDGSMTRRTSPVNVPGLTNVVELAAGGAHTCARLMDNTVRCWGWNSSRQLGDRSTVRRTSPVAVACFATAPTMTCPTGQTTCGMSATCVNTQTSVANCGGCGMQCALANVATNTCAAGACGVGACATGFGNCDGNAANGCETNTQTSNAYCGSCSNACSSGQMCVNGSCASTCTMTTCGSACVNPQTDTAHCGGCDQRCALANVSTQSCVSGACAVGACAAGFANCNNTPGDGCEVNTQTSVSNCGGCGMACTLANVATNTCAAGACGVGTCNAGFGNCDGMAANGCETNTQTSNAHCGACNNACAAGQTCTAGTCATPGDACTMPLTLDLTQPAQTVMGTTAGMTSSTEGCAGGADVFYRFTLTRRELVYFDTFGTSFDTQLRLHTNNCAMAVGTCADNACTGNQSQLVQVLDAGTYILVVDGATGASGAFTLRVQHLPAGNGPVNPLASMSGTQTVMATSSGASGISTSCGGGGVGPEAVWWLATCPDFAGGAMTAGTCAGASFDTVVEQQSAARMPIAVCNDDFCGTQSRVMSTLPSGAGLHTVIADAYYANMGGALTVAVTLTPSGGCTLPEQSCGGVCVNTQTSNAHCGACNNACPSGQTCTAGVCAMSSCPTGQTRCSGSCVNTNTDVTNCGACGVSCPPFGGFVCNNGMCTMGGGGCPTGQTSCAGMCVDTRSDRANCGACGNTCSGGFCLSSACATLSSQVRPSTTTAGNPGGAQPFNDLCGTLHALVGFNTWSSGGINGIAAICRQILVDLPGGVPTVTLDTSDSVRPTRGTTSGTMETVRCPSGQVAVGFSGSADAGVQRIALRCAPVTAMLAGSSLVFGVGSVTNTSEVGGAPATAFGPHDCGSGDYAAGASIGINGGVASLSLACGRPITF